MYLHLNDDENQDDDHASLIIFALHGLIDNKWREKRDKFVDSFGVQG